MKRLYARILLYVIGLIVLAQAAVFGAFVATRGRRGSRVLHEHALGLTRHLAEELRRAGPAALRGRIAELAGTLNVLLTLRDAAGALVAHAGEPLPVPASPTGVAMLRLPGGGRRWVATVPYPGGGTLRMSPTATFEWSALELAAAFAGVLGLVGLLLIPLVRRITRPVRELEAAARAIAAGDLARRAQVATQDEIGALARAFNQMADQIAASLRHEKDLVASVSHELRAPLSRIRMAVELLADGRDLSDAARSHLQSIAEEVGELDGLIEELLTRARLESAGFVLEREDVDLCELAREVVKRTGSAADRVDMELSPGIVPVRGSRTLLARALRNVLENALQYSAPETRVRLSVREDGRRAVVRIEDRGVGIPPEEVPRVFEPFFRGERSRSRRTGGVGFGLTLTREIVRRHGGEIDIASTVGAGTTVTLSLPRG